MKTQSVVSLDPIDRKNKKQPGVIGRLFLTRRFRGKPMKKTDPIIKVNNKNIIKFLIKPPFLLNS